MTTSEKRKKFLKNLKHETMKTSDIAKFLTSFAVKGGDIGTVLHKININFSDDTTIPQKNFDWFTSNIYNLWQKSIFDNKKNLSTFFQSFTPDSSQTPSVKIIPPIIIQNPKEGDQLQHLQTFLHIHPNAKCQKHQNISCRLYLNLDVPNALSLGVLLSEKCIEKDIPLYFKVWTTRNERNDTFIVFTNYDHVQEIVEIIQEFEETKPELFKGATNANPFLARVDNYIFFGEEPSDNGSSFTRLRAMALTEFFKHFNSLGELEKADAENLSKIITDANLEPFFTKFGISIKKPFLNLEEQPLKEQE